MSQDVGRGPAQAGQQIETQYAQYPPRRGSVRRARERLPPGPVPIRTGLPPPAAYAQGHYPPPPPGYRPPPKPYGAERPPRQLAPPPMRSRPPVAGPYPSRRGNPGPGGIGAAISRPSANPQWPLQEELPPAPRRLNNSPTREKFGLQRGPPPQRPPRPSFVPSLPETSPIPEHGPQRTERPQLEYWEDNFQRPSPAGPSPSTATAYTPSAPSTRPSTTSSAVTIPDFPVPASHNARKSQNSGPPSASRRNFSSYYSQGSYVTPIPEEAESGRARVSAGSSNVIPSSWGSGPPDYYLSAEAGNGFDEGHPEEDERESRSTTNDDDERTLVRKASLGKRHKPSLTTIRSSDKMDKEAAKAALRAPTRTSSSEELSDHSRKGKPKRKGPVVEPIPTTTVTEPPSRGPSPAVPYPSAEKGPSASTESLSRQPNAITTDTLSPPPTRRGRASLLSPVESRISRMFGLGDKRSSARSSANPSPSPDPYQGGKMTPPKRPPRLDMDAVREGEQRGSLTSLPDLILRATKLAAVLDRGRPASRWESQFPGEEQGDRGLSPRRRSGSISDMLASFPSPGLVSRDGAGSRGANRSKSPFATSALAFGEKADDDSDVAKSPRRRKCCGMSIPVLILVLLLILVIVAAAVVLPIVFVVLPRQHHASTSNSGLTQCQKDLVCMNGGRNILDGGSCRCLCVGGYTGSSCSTAPDKGCVTTNINTAGGSSVNDATLGSSIPRLLQQGPQNFSIPLDSSVLLPQFSASGLSCGSENALVTFNGRSSRVSGGSSARRPRDVPNHVRAAVSKTASAEPTVMTSNGIVFANPTQATGGSSAPPTPSASSLVVDETTLDFARVCVLYILQRTTNVNRAVTAQQNLQHFLQTTGRTASTSAGNGITVDFGKFTIDFGNGTIGGGGNKSSSTSTPRL